MKHSNVVCVCIICKYMRRKSFGLQVGSKSKAEKCLCTFGRTEIQAHKSSQSAAMTYTNAKCIYVRQWRLSDSPPLTPPHAAYTCNTSLTLFINQCSRALRLYFFCFCFVSKKKNGRWTPAVCWEPADSHPEKHEAANKFRRRRWMLTSGNLIPS